MVHVCEEYAASFNIIFNGSKSLLMVFGNSHDCEVYVSGDPVKVVKSMKHLGHVITDDINDSAVQPIVNDFNTKVNTFLAYFNEVRCDVKNSLFNQYCTSFYGAHITMLYHKDVENLYVAWRKALRKLWHLPYRAHCNLLPHVSDSLPAKVMFCKRFLKHYISGFNSSNELVSTIYKSAMYSMSRLGKNVRYVCQEYGFDVWNTDFSSYNANGAITRKWNCSVNEEDVRIGVQVRELCIERDRLNDWLLDRGEVTDIIEYLCLS